MVGGWHRVACLSFGAMKRVGAGRRRAYPEPVQIKRPDQNGSLLGRCRRRQRGWSHQRLPSAPNAGCSFASPWCRIEIDGGARSRSAQAEQAVGELFAVVVTYGEVAQRAVALQVARWRLVLAFRCGRTPTASCAAPPRLALASSSPACKVDAASPHAASSIPQDQPCPENCRAPRASCVQSGSPDPTQRATFPMACLSWVALNLTQIECNPL